MEKGVKISHREINTMSSESTVPLNTCFIFDIWEQFEQVHFKHVMKDYPVLHCKHEVIFVMVSGRQIPC